MFIRNKDLKGLAIRATDGDLGKIEELYFDDETWGVRYFVVETGNWLSGRKVLVSPISIINVNYRDNVVDVAMTQKQVRNAPTIDLHRPVSRQHEAEYMVYYGYPYYWNGPYMWGGSDYPAQLSVPGTVARMAQAEIGNSQLRDSHLRTTAAVDGYHIEAKDGEIGHVKDFVIDDNAWAIRYLEVATSNWWPGKNVLLSPAWVERVSWEESKVFVAATREAIQTCPEFDPTMIITREYENRLYFHYGRPPYWIEEVKDETVLAGMAN